MFFSTGVCLLALCGGKVCKVLQGDGGPYELDVRQGTEQTTERSNGVASVGARCVASCGGAHSRRNRRKKEEEEMKKKAIADWSISIHSYVSCFSDSFVFVVRAKEDRRMSGRLQEPDAEFWNDEVRSVKLN
jgi:hypothetical protein